MQFPSQENANKTKHQRALRALALVALGRCWQRLDARGNILALDKGDITALG